MSIRSTAHIRTCTRTRTHGHARRQKVNAKHMETQKELLTSLQRESERRKKAERALQAKQVPAS